MKFAIENRNGLTMIAVQKSTPAQTFNAGLNFKVGAGYEEKKLAGISHFLEHSVFLGSKKYPSRELIEEKLLSFGGDYNAFTGLHHTTYCLSGQVTALQAAVETLYDLGLHAKLDNETEIKKEKKVVLAELEQELTELGTWSDQTQVAYETLFKGTVLAQNILGSKKTIQSFNIETLQQYHQYNYHPSRACLTVVSPLKPEEALERMAGVSVITRRRSTVATGGPFSLTTPRKAMKVVKCIKTASYTWDLDFFYDFDRPKDPKYIVALKLLTLVLFHSEMSYIFGAARKAGLVYTVQGGHHSYLGTDVFRVATNLAADNAGKFGKLYRKQIKKLLTEGINKTFLGYCKAHYEFSRQMALEHYDSYAFKLTEKNFLGESDTLLPEEELAWLEQVTEADILKMLALIDGSPRKVITVKGPDATSELEEQLNADQAFI